MPAHSTSALVQPSAVHPPTPPGCPLLLQDKVLALVVKHRATAVKANGRSLCSFRGVFKGPTSVDNMASLFIEKAAILNSAKRRTYCGRSSCEQGPVLFAYSLARPNCMQPAWAASLRLRRHTGQLCAQATRLSLDACCCRVPTCPAATCLQGMEEH